MNSQAELSNLVLTRRLADGTVEWIPLAVPQRVSADPGAAYALIDRANYEAPQAMVAERQGDDLVIEVDSAEVLVLNGFFATPAVTFYPSPDVAGGAGPFSGSPLSAESPVLAGSPEGEQVVWSAEQGDGHNQDDGGARVVGNNPSGGGGSPALWGGLAAGGLLLGLAAAGGGGGSGGGSGDGGAGGGGGTGGGGGSTVDTSPPQITSGRTAPSIPENSGAGQVVYTATATDASPFTWSLAGGDAAAFSIDATTGAVTLTDNPDFETKPSYSFTVVATDAANNRAELAVGLSIGDQNDSAPFITSGATAAAIGENSGADQVVYTATATDTGALTWSLKDVGDAAAFGIDAASGAVTLAGDPDYETKASYSFTVVATDVDGNSSEQVVQLAINNLDEVAPTITSGATAPAINENSGSNQVVYTAIADDTGDISGGVAFSLKPGADAAAFSINATTGAVTLTDNPNQEAKPRYDFTVVATDAAGHSAEQAVRLTINDLDEVAPTITSGATAKAINENSGAGQVVYTVTSTDKGDISTGNTAYSLLSGGDAAAFSINASSGAVTLTGNPNFEAKSSYSFTVVATDAAGNSSQRAVSLAINNVDEVAPTITSGATAPAISENSGAGQVVYTVTSTDTGDISTGSTTYSLSSAGDAAAFSINGSTGAVKLTANPDFESKSSYNFTVVATDAAGNSSQRPVSLGIINVVDETAPTVSDVAFTGAIGAQSNTLNAGDIVHVTVTMSENTNVDTSGGTPRIALNVGGSTDYARYASGSGTTNLVFDYTVQPGDTDKDGISISKNSLQQNGGSLTDTAGNVAVLSHAKVDPSFLVDTTAPTLTSSTPADGSTGIAVGDDIVLKFSENVQTGSGNITISDGSDARTIGVTDGSQVSVSGNQVTVDPTSDLNTDSTYNVQIAGGAITDPAGNAYTGINNSTTLNFDTELSVDTSIVVFDLVQGSSSDHSGRTFQSGVSYDIYIRVDSADSNLSTAGGGPGTWGAWSGAANLGSDDRIILVGNGSDVQAPIDVVGQISVGPTAVAWLPPVIGGPAAELRDDGSLHRTTGFAAGEHATAALFNAALPGAFLSGQEGQLSTMYAINMPAGILTSQGLA